MLLPNKVVLAALCATRIAYAAVSTVTLTSYGVVVGTTTTLTSPATATVAVNKWLGIPYAASPKMFIKATTPAALAPTVTKFATAYSSACYQDYGGSSGLGPVISSIAAKAYDNPDGPRVQMSSDCLYANVFAPLDAKKGALKPVMFWIYGGGFQNGASNFLWYDGSSFAANQDVVVVTFNYRTNVFGQSGSPALNASDNNVGLWDQRLALQWTQNNIAQFGGDPTKVTIFGQSAGSDSVKQLLTAPPVGPSQFWGAIIQSKGVSTEFGDSSSSWTSLAKLLGCTNTANPTLELQCVQKFPASTILAFEQNQTLSFTPIVDNITAFDSIQRNIASAAKVPVMMGSTSEEPQLLFAGLGNAAGNSNIVTELFQYYFPSFDIPTVVANITGTAAGSTTALSRVLADFMFGCPTRAFAEYLVSNNYPVWRYYFDAQFANTQPYPNSGVYHASEIALEFGTYRTTTNQSEIALSTLMQTQWANFAKNPAGGPGPGNVWKQFAGVGQGFFNDPVDLQYYSSDGTGKLVAESKADTSCKNGLFWSFAQKSY